jgi:hypothetical protein
MQARCNYRSDKVWKETVLARKVLPQDESVWIDGGTASSEEELWQIIVERLELFQDLEEESSSATTGALQIKGAAEANILVAKRSGELGTSVGQERGKAKRRSRTASSRVTALSGLRGKGLPLIIDDFHYLSRDLQGQIIRALKPLIFDGVPVAVIAIPHRRYDAVKVEREMTGRISSIHIPSWSHHELRFIPEKGFNLLGYHLHDANAQFLAENAIGSPHLMQDFCRGICKLLPVGGSNQSEGTAISNGTIKLIPRVMENIFREVADTAGRPMFEKLARAPRQRTDRIPRELVDGRRVDIYQLVLHALASLKPGLVTLEYEDLRSALRNVAGSQLPQLQEVARVLKHMATIAASDQSSTPVIDFEEDEKKLHMTDPFFAFYLRWGDLSASGEAHAE